VAVLTEPSKPVGRTHVLTPTPVHTAAQKLGIPTYTPVTKQELLDTLTMIRADLGVVVAYGHILTPAMLDTANLGFVNLHFSLLPRYRGATPIQATLLANETETGVTLMRIDAGLDTGPILAQTSAGIEPTDTTASLTDRLALVAATLAAQAIPKFAAGMLSSTAQPNESPTPITRQLSKSDGEIDWSQSGETIERFIRAMQPWPKAWTELDGQRFIVHSAHLTASGLVIDQIQAAGKEKITGAEFARGYQNALTALSATGKVAPHNDA